jgi:hypothetical protein
MPKLVCSCGFIHDLSPIPDKGWVTIADVAYEEIIEAHVRQAGQDLLASKIESSEGRLYECTPCGRILWKKPGEKIFRSFRLEA